MKTPLLTLLSIATLLAAGCANPAGSAKGTGWRSSADMQLASGLGAHVEGAAPVAATRTTQANLPPRVDLRAKMPPVYDQGPFQTCTGFAIAKGLGEYLLRLQGDNTPLSALHLYHRTKGEQFNQGGLQWLPSVSRVNAARLEDIGAAIASGMQVLKGTGAIKEEAFPYPQRALWYSYRYSYISPKFDSRLINEPEFLSSAVRRDSIQLADGYSRPGEFDTTYIGDAKGERITFSSAFTRGIHLKVRQIRQVRTMAELQGALAASEPVVFALDVYESFNSAQVARTGRVPVPDLAREKRLGAHAVLCVGFDEPTQTLIVRNSWGPGWGDGGYCHLPYAYVQMGLVKDGWTAKL